MEPPEQNMITDWLKENGNPEIEIQVLNEVVDKLVEERDTLLKQRDEFAIGFAEWRVNDWVHDERWTKISDIKELLEIYKKEKRKLNLKWE
jgi:methyl coenzyme M reductase beta subunit